MSQAYESRWRGLHRLDGPARLQPWRQLLGYTRCARRGLIVGVMLGPVGTLGMLLQPLAAKALVDALGSGRPLAGPALALAALLLASAAVRGGNLWLLERSAEQAVRGVRRRLAHHLLRLTVGVTDRHASGDLTSRVTADTTLLRSGASRGLVESVTGVVGLVGAVAFMGVIDLRLLAVTLVVIGSLLVVAFVLLARTRAATEEAQQAVGAIGAELERVLVAARSVKSNQAEEREFDRIAAHADQAYTAGLRFARQRALTGLVAGVGLQTTFLTVLAYGGVLVSAGSLEFSSLIAFLLYVFYLTGPIGGLVTGISQINQALGAVGRLAAIEKMPVEDEVPAMGVPTTPTRGAAWADHADRAGDPMVAFDGVEFRYRDDRPPALTGVSFTVARGGQTAIVGPSGAGKSTLFGLLLRFYDPDAGCVRVAGRDLRELPQAAVRSRIAYVPQDAPILAGTIEDSLRYGAPNADAEALQEAVRDARLGDLIDRLPDGLGTDVGPRGVALSGGERQRLAIAQALLRRPDLLLLDEVTGQLDALNEHALREAIARAGRRCTVMVIAHRLSTVVDADRIIVLDHGAVRAIGTHQDLIVADALYRQLAATQLVDGRTSHEARQR